MAMRETTGSIRAYFIITGLLSGVFNYVNFASGMANNVVILVLISGAGLLISLGFLVIGAVLSRLLGNGALIPKGLIGVNCLYLIGLIVLLMQLLPPEQAGGAAVKPGLGLLISWYLWSNLTRLSAEFDEKEAGAAIPPGQDKL